MIFTETLSKMPSSSTWRGWRMSVVSSRGVGVCGSSATTAHTPRLSVCSTFHQGERHTARYALPDRAVPRDHRWRCTKGSVYDVIVDIRPHSPTYRGWFGTVLSADNRRSVYAPEGFAHGFLTLENDVEAFYQISQYYPLSTREDSGGTTPLSTSPGPSTSRSCLLATERTPTSPPRSCEWP